MAIAALVFNFLCSSYFNVGRTNIVYDAIYFVTGGLFFHYRKELAEFARKYKVIDYAILLASTISYFVLGFSTFTMLFFCVAVMTYTLGCSVGVLINPVAKFFGGISFEIYLCHMVIYRVLEKLHLIHLFGDGMLAYVFTAVAVICGSVVFSVCAKWFLNKIEAFVKKKVNNRRINHV